jgi:hypothetical protein
VCIPKNYYVADCFAIPSYVATTIPDAFVSAAACLEETMNQNCIVPLGVVVDPEKEEQLIGIVTTSGILRLLPTAVYSAPPHTPTLVASSKLCEELRRPEICVPLEKVTSILELIRPQGTLLSDHGSQALAIVWWSTQETYLLAIINHLLLKKIKTQSKIF